MNIITKTNGKVQQHDLGERPLTVVLHQQPIKIEVPEAEVHVTPEATMNCMRTMSQRAWEHISTGPLFQHLFNKLFTEKHAVRLPKKIETLLSDYDDGVIHACGLIIMLVEARLEGKTKVFIKNPETHLHPAVQMCLMDVINDIRKMGDGSDNDGEGVTA